MGMLRVRMLQVGMRRVGMMRRLRILWLGRVRILGGGEEDAASGDAASGDVMATEELAAGASNDPGASKYTGAS